MMFMYELIVILSSFTRKLCKRLIRQWKVVSTNQDLARAALSTVDAKNSWSQKLCQASIIRETQLLSSTRQHFELLQQPLLDLSKICPTYKFRMQMHLTASRPRGGCSKFHCDDATIKEHAYHAHIWRRDNATSMPLVSGDHRWSEPQ